MLKRWTTSFFLIILLAQPAFADSSGLNPTPVPTPDWPKYISKTDFSFFKNAEKWTFEDFDYFKDPKNPEESVPEDVLAVFRKEAKEDLKGLVRFDQDEKMTEQEVPDPAKVYSPIYVFQGPASIKVYALHVQGWAMVGDPIGNSYIFVLYDSEKKKVWPKPIEISTRWGDIGTDRNDLPPTVVKPLIEFMDIFGNGSKTFVVEDILHSGTWTAVLYHHYEIDTNFNLIDVLDLETRNSGTGEWWDKNYFEVNRKIVGHKGNQITVEITMEGIDVPVIDIGSMILERNGPFAPYKIIKKIKKNKDPFFDMYYYIGADKDL